MPSPSRDGGFGHILGQLGPLGAPASKSDQLVATANGHGHMRLRWAPEGQSVAGAPEAREHLKRVVNNAIRALSNGSEDALEILFPEQFTRPFEWDAPALNAGMLVPLAQAIEDRLETYASPPSVVLSHPITPKNKGELIPFLCKVSPGSFLSAQRGNNDQIALTSRLVHAPGDSEKLAKRLIAQLFNASLAELARLGSRMPDAQRRDILRDFTEEPLTARAASRLLEHITVISEDHRVSRETGMDGWPMEFDVSGEPGPALGKPGPTPTEVIAWLVDVADAAGASASGGPKELLNQLARSAKAHWLSDRLDTPSTLRFLGNLRNSLQQTGGHALAPIASAIQRKIDALQSHGPYGPSATRLHDNINGRVWESAFAETLAEAPSHAMLQTSTDVRKLMLDVFLRCTPAQKKAIAPDAFGRVESGYPGSWLGADPDFESWQEHPASVRKLERFLKTPATDGPSCMSTYLVGCRLLAAIGEEAPGIATWKARSDESYEHLLNERGEDKFPKDDYQQGPDAGLQMRHQLSPTFASYEDDDVRGVLSSVQDFDDRTDSMNRSLNTGRPIIWGPSGTTNLLLHFLEDPSVQRLARNGLPDINHAILGIATMVIRDGGHSLREVLSAAARIVGPLLPPALLQAQSVRDAASHYGGFFQLFSGDPETVNLLRHANEQAWRTTLEYRRDMRPG